MTLRAEKKALNEELQKLLAMPPEELAKVEPAAMFRDLRTKVQKKSVVQA